MPSLSTKTEPVVSLDPAEFSKNMVVMMEKKVRNLEKRKGKLEDYKAKQAGGQTLNEEQLKAVAKLDDVLSQIELLQDLTKQFGSYGAEAVKLQKRQQKKERFEQIENEKKRFAEVLQLQSILNALGVDETRQAFATGSEGTVKLQESELNHLDELYKIINPERGVEESLADQIKTSAEHLQSVLDGRDKEILGTTYKELRDLISKIKDCPYFTQTVKPAKVEVADAADTSTEKDFVMVKTDEVPHADSEEVQLSLPPEVIPEQAPEPEQPPYQQQINNQLPQEPPKTFEKIVENVQGRFNFIQESEIDIDSPSHVDPAVLSVHQMPTHQYQQQDNSMYSQATSESAFQQYNVQSNSHPASVYTQQETPQPMPLPKESVAAPVAAPNQSLYSQSSQSDSDGVEHKYENGMTFENSNHKQASQHSNNEDYNQRGQTRRGGYRGGRGGPSNGYGGGSRGGWRGGSDRGGYRGGDRGGERGDRHHSPSGNGFSGSDNRRGGRGGPRGGNAGYRGGAPGRGGRGAGGHRGGYRGQSQQQSSNAAQQ